MRAVRALALLVAGLLVASALAACATIPRGGPVTRGGSVSQQDNGFGQIDYHPAGPGQGETQEQILRGFIEAAVSPENGYQIAREYLSDSFRSQWNPDASVTVDQAAMRQNPVSVTPSDLSMKVTPVAFIDQSGDYTTAASQTPIPLSYGFVKQGDQWRISRAPDGIVIDTSLFQNVFSAYPLYFYSPDYDYLVPDLRWFPSSRASIATRIVKALLAGPSPWLQDAVATAFPKGTQLANGSVVVQGGTAQVALSSVASGADSATVNRMDEQLTQSLTTSASIGAVDLNIGGVNESPSGVSGAQRDPAVNANPLVVKDDKLGFLSGKTVVPADGIGTQVSTLKPSALSVTADGSAAAVLADGSVYAVAASLTAPVRVDHRAGLIAPSIDNRGNVWSATSDPDAAFAIAAADGSTALLKGSWPDARQLISFAVSRDGTRLAALVTENDGQPHVMVAGIARDASGHPSRIGEAVDLGPLNLSRGLSMTWTDELTVAVLGTGTQGGTQIIDQQLGGQASSPSPGPDGGAVIAGGNPSSQFWVLTANGALETPAGNGWQTATTGVTALATQQGRG